MTDTPANEPSLQTSPTPLPGVFLRGMLMGAADIVPGVSGGTIAFITGIYQRLINALSSIGPHLIGQWRREGFASIWAAVDGSFLLALVSGIAVSVLTLARVIATLLESQPVLLWSFFFGLILASALVLTRHVQRWHRGTVLALLAGLVVAATIGLSPAVTLPVAPLSFFVAGFIAICAMILPGISGSFVLVLLGLYPAVLQAIRGFELVSLALFATGALCGLLVFTRLLRWLLASYHSVTLATLTGFLFGSLPVVWPWKLPTTADLLHPVLPSSYAASGAAVPALTWCVLAMVVGAVAVWLLESRWGGLER